MSTMTPHLGAHTGPQPTCSLTTNDPHSLTLKGNPMIRLVHYGNTVINSTDNEWAVVLQVFDDINLNFFSPNSIEYIARCDWFLYLEFLGKGFKRYVFGDRAVPEWQIEYTPIAPHYVVRMEK
jgi:hypothetical protein